MKLKDFKKQAETLIESLEDLVHNLPQKGDRPSECRRLTLLQALYEFHYAVNGTEQQDLE